ncbi:hypothetical protein P3T76_010122 [Phytophthora citrophthora]|uniref:Uncharacterized protein n=1 Tax=Phytophthora citrophthora TaxID=4793 RepID=A0AAD9GE31_9STRA|nr:hypothetical protein P3T76_010122 [Phytophthora citrophthora]
MVIKTKELREMTAIIGLLLLIAVAVAGFVSRGWLTARQSLFKDHSKKQEELHVDGVEIVVQKPVNERRLKLALPDLSSIQLNSPVGPMKSSIRSALKELRSRQMVQNLCSRFESRLKVSSNERETSTASTKKTEEVPTLTMTRARRRDAREATIAPVVLASELTKESEISANVRSNNLNKFLRSYASNLDNAISSERRVVMETDAIPTERSVVMATDAEDDVAQPLLGQNDKNSTAEEVTTPSESCADSDGSGMELDLDLQTLRLGAEYSNQCDSPPPAGSEEGVAVMVEATDCEPLADEKSDESDEGNNNNDNTRKTTAEKLSIAFTLSDFILDKQFVPESSHPSDNEPETSSFPPAKEALARFKQQVPSNRRARNIATLRL